MMRRYSEIAWVLTMWILYPVLLVMSLISILRSEDASPSLLRFGFAALGSFAVFSLTSRAIAAGSHRKTMLNRGFEWGIWAVLAGLVASTFLSEALYEIFIGVVIGLGFAMCWPTPRNVAGTLVHGFAAAERKGLAARIARWSTKLWRKDEYAWMLLAEALGQDKQDEMLGAYRAGLEHLPSSHLLMTAYAGELTWLRRHDEAVQLLDRAAGLAPQDPWPLIGLARVAWSQGNWTEARRHSLAALALTAPDDVSERDIIAVMLSCVPGELERARGIVEELAEVAEDPNHFVHLAAWAEDEESRTRFMARAAKGWPHEATVEEEVERFRASWLRKKQAADHLEVSEEKQAELNKSIGR